MSHPFALRRQALGLVRTVVEAKLRFSLSKLVAAAMDALSISDAAARDKMQADVAEFLRLRVKNVLDEAGVRYDVADAVLGDVDDICAVYQRADAVQKALTAGTLETPVQAFTRAANLAQKAESADFDAAAFGVPGEKREWNEKMLRLMQHLQHLEPPNAIAPLMLAVDSVPTMVYDLAASDVYFDYVTNYVTRHPSIAQPGQFHITDADYADFEQNVAASDFTYNGRTAAALTQLRALARFEGRDEDARAEFDALEAKLKANDLTTDLRRFRQHIQPFLETEIVSRYYYQRGALQQQLTTDKAVRKAVETLTQHSR